MGAFSNPTMFFNEFETGKLYNTLVMVAHLMKVITGSADWNNGLIALLDHPNIPQDRMGFIADWQKLEIVARVNTSRQANSPALTPRHLHC